MLVYKLNVFNYKLLKNSYLDIGILFLDILIIIYLF